MLSSILRKTWPVWLLLLTLLSAPAMAWTYGGARDLEVSVVDDRGRTFPLYDARGRSRAGTYKAYLEAAPGAPYAIQIRNTSNRRIGVVVAVDGRNIISGERSDLSPRERMYILGPYEQGTYEGWRTGRNRVNRFYFTREEDSYSAAFGDHSAMGVIAVAAYREDRPHRYRDYGYGDKARPQGPQDKRAGSARRSEPGTGFGHEEWSPSRRVPFDPQSRPFVRVFYKYEWRDTLCRQGIGDCERRNRFWDRRHSGFAPYPPGHRGHWK